MKRKKISYIVFSLAILVILAIILTGKRGLFTGGKVDFAIRDTSLVRLIRITGRDTVVIKRSGTGWMVNGKEKADPVAVNNFLFAFSRIRVTGMTNKPLKPHVNSRVLEIRVKRKIRRYLFYPGGRDPRMSPLKSDKIYNVDIPGFPEAGLDKIINGDPGYWRDKMLVDLRADEIRSVKVIPAPEWGRGFTIVREDGDLRLKDPEGEAIPDTVTDDEKVLMYMSYFNRIYYDSVYSGPENYRQMHPDYTVEITGMSDERDKLEMYPLRHEDGNPDIFRGLVRYNDGEDLLVVRYVMLDLIRQNLSHFTVK